MIIILTMLYSAFASMVVLLLTKNAMISAFVWLTILVIGIAFDHLIDTIKESGFYYEDEADDITED